MLTIQRTLKDKLAANNIGEVLQTLKKVFEQNNDAYDEVIALQNRYKRLVITQRKGTLSFDEETRLLNNLIANIASIINDITAREEEAYELETAIFTKILIISRTEERSAAMKKLFSEDYYKEVKYLVPKEIVAIEELQPYEIIIFDNMDTDENYFEHYTHCLLYTSPSPRDQRGSRMPSSA